MPAVVASGSATTILFTDIEDSTVLVDTLGDRRWLDLLRLHNTLVRERVAEFQGFEVKTVGDGFMVAFASPEAAVACAVSIQQGLVDLNAGSGAPAVRVRIGLHTGAALRDEDDFFGREVVMAARVSAAARGGEVLISDAVRSSLGPDVSTAAPRVRELKGLRGRHRLHPVLWDRSEAPRDERGERLQERARELDALRQTLAEARAGRGGATAVVGPAGIGKSALLDTLAGRARDDGIRVIRAQGFEVERGYPFGVARELLAGAVERLDSATLDALIPLSARQALGLADDEGAEAPGEHALLEGLTRALDVLTERSPTLLLVDDVQWADDPSLSWLAYLSRRLRERPVALVVGVRDDGELRPEALDGLIGSPQVARVRPGVLSAEAAEALVQSRMPSAQPAFVGACRELSGGVPLYLHELITSAQEAGLTGNRAAAEALGGLMTSSVERLVHQRLAGLGSPELALARACATLDTRADLRAAAKLAGLSAADALAAADSLCSARLLQARRPLQFVHPIMRSAVLAGLTAAERSRLHAETARMLRADGAPPEAIAAHLLLVAPGELPDIVQQLREAADRALADGAPGAAERFLGRALDEPPREADAPGLLAALAAAQLRQAKAAQAAATARRALEVATAPEDRLAALAALAPATEAELLDPDNAAAWDPDGRRVVGLLEEFARSTEDQALLFEVEALSLTLTTAQEAMSGDPRPPETVERLERLARTATGESRGERAVLGHLAGYRLTTGTAPAERALELARRACDGTPDTDPDLWTGAIEVLIAGDAHAEAEQHLATIARRAQRLGLPVAEMYAACYRAWNAWAAGALEDAMAFRHDTLALARDVTGDEYVEAICDGLACGVHLTQGDPAAARRVALGTAHAGMRDRTLGLVLFAEGDPEGAAEHLYVVWRRFEKRGLWRTPGPLRPVRPDLAVALVAAGDIDEARAVADAEEEVARRFGSASCVAEALRAQAAALGEAGPLREAAQVVRGCEARLVEADVLVSLGRMTEGAEAERALKRGLGIAQRRGATAIADRAQEALAAL